MDSFREMIERNLPILVVVVPLLGGILSVFMGRGQRPWLWACAVTSAVLALCCLLLVRVMESPNHVVTCALGNWPPPWGIEYRVDPLNAFVLAVVATIAVVVTLYSRLSVMKEIGLERQRFFYSLWLLAIAGLLGITVTGDAFNVYVLLEISSLTIYGLIAMGKEHDRRALTATFNYLILGSIGASFILLGIGYLYMMTGTLNMEDMRVQLQVLLAEDPGNRTVLTAFAFLMVGLAMKMALFPLHVWLPNAYTYAPTAVSALLAATATKVAVYMSFRFLYTIFGLDFAFERVPNNIILMVCASSAIVFGSFSAIRQTNLKRLLAYSSVGQIGYIVLGFSLANHNGVTGSLVHIFYHALIKGGMFLALGAVIYRLGSAQLADLRGIGRRMPITMAAFTLGGFGLVGVPLTGGFVSKFYLISGALDREMWPVAIVILVGSVFALAYMWRIVEIAYLQPPPDDCEKIQEAPLSLVVPAVALIGVSILYGVSGVGIVEIAENAANALRVSQ